MMFLLKLIKKMHPIGSILESKQDDRSSRIWRSPWVRFALSNRIRVLRPRLKHGSRIHLQLTSNWTGVPRSPRHFEPQVLLRSLALSPQLASMTESRRYRACQRSSCRSALNLCRCIAIMCGSRTSLYLHTDHSSVFEATSSISIPHRAVGPARRSIMCITPCHG